MTCHCCEDKRARVRFLRFIKSDRPTPMAPSCRGRIRTAAAPLLSLSIRATRDGSDTDRGLLTSIDHDMNNEWIHGLNNACINVE